MRFLKPPKYTYYIDLEEVWRNGTEKPVYAKWASWRIKKEKQKQKLGATRGKTARRAKKKTPWKTRARGGGRNKKARLDKRR
ncbi:hypothetical protein E3E51_01625 [Thermococcus sp. 21S7]|nr:hypothetical protein [Thermococcus sp. 21S7]